MQHISSPTQCPICHQARKPLYKWSGYQVFQCEVCGTESISPVPSAEELSHFYQSISAKKIVRWQRRLQLVERAFGAYVDKFQTETGFKPESFLDLGGGVGYYVRAAQGLGIEACLMEWAGDAMRFARETLGLHWIVEGDISRCADYLDAERFHMILARHTIEHMRDPRELLVQLKSLLRPGGILLLETPDAESNEQFSHLAIAMANFRILSHDNQNMSGRQALSHALRKSCSGVNPPKHLWGFTLRGLTKLVESVGLDVIHSERAISGHRVHDPLFYDFHRLSSRRGLGIPYYFWQRATSLLFQGRGSNLCLMVRKV